MIVQPDGIVYYAAGFRVYTPWENIIGLTRAYLYQHTLLAFHHFPGFQLREKCRLDLTIEEGRQQHVPVLETDWWNPAWSLRPLMDKFLIPEVLIGSRWQNEDFGRYIRQYVPHISNGWPYDF